MQDGKLDGFARVTARSDMRQSDDGSFIPVFNSRSAQHKALTRSVADWILMDGLHIQAVEGAGFRNMLKMAEPCFDPPHRNYFQQVDCGPNCIFKFHCSMFIALFFQKYFVELNRQVKALQKETLHDSSLDCTAKIDDVKSTSVFCCPNPFHPISFTVDGWSGPDHESYFCVTAHWLDKDFKMRHALLDILLCTDRHTGENLRDWLKQVFADNDIDVGSLFLNVGLLAAYDSLFMQRLDIAALTHDHGPDISKAIRKLSPLHSFICFDHELDRSVCAGIDSAQFHPIFVKCTDIVSTIRNSNNCFRVLRDAQVHPVHFCILGPA